MTLIIKEAQCNTIEELLQHIKDLPEEMPITDHTGKPAKLKLVLNGPDVNGNKLRVEIGHNK